MGKAKDRSEGGILWDVLSWAVRRLSTAIIDVKIGLIPDFQQVQRNPCVLDCCRTKGFDDRLGFQIRGC